MSDLQQLQVEERYFSLNEGLFQKILIVATLKSFSFYKLIKDRVCPYEQYRLSRRPDFTAKFYNNIYAIVAKWWDHWTPVLNPNADYSVSLDQLEEMLSAESKAGYINKDDAQAWFDSLKLDYEILNFSPSVLQSLASHPSLTEWLNKRAAAGIIDYVSTVNRHHTPTLDTLAQKVADARLAIDPGENRVVGAFDLMNSATGYTKPIPTEFSTLNTALGGGLRLGESVMIAGINASGKTVLATQLGMWLAQHGLNVVVCTTERKPQELLNRMLSSFLKVDFSRFTNRADLPNLLTVFERVQIPVVPQDIQNEFGDKVLNLMDVWQRIRFMDWTKGSLTLYRDFDKEVGKLESTGWKPHVIVFDWIGGGLENVRNSKLEMRHVYNEAANILISHGKRNNRCMIMTAQINKSQTN